MNVAKKKFPIGDYDVYKTITKKQIGDIINTWWVGNNACKKLAKKSTETSIIYFDELKTIKYVDETTANHLYHRNLNPVSISILCPVGAKFKTNENNELLYDMKAQIHSVDDSSYGIWWNEIPFNTLVEIRKQLIRWVDLQKKLNGDEFIKICTALGANPETIDYN